ncbi:hypothetical protein ACLB2K_047202 [Fragaria x ananassa]
MARKVSYLAVARPSEGERESQIHFLSRDFWADDGHDERREGFHLRDTLLLAPIVSTCFIPSREGLAKRGHIEFFGPTLGTCTSNSIRKSGLWWSSLRLSDA